MKNVIGGLLLEEKYTISTGCVGRFQRIPSKKGIPLVVSWKAIGHSPVVVIPTATALPTAEGAVQVAMEELPFTLHSARVLILGFGRVGKLTAHRMGALGAKVTVCAQGYADLAWAAAYGHETMWLEKLGGELGGYDLIVNTIPAQVLDRRRLAWVHPGAFLLDLASAPGGVDQAAAKELGLRVLQAPGLPGRTAPVTAAAAIRDAVYHILWELEA